MFRSRLHRMLSFLALVAALVVPVWLWAADGPPTSGNNWFGLAIPLMMAAAPMLLALLKSLAPRMPKSWVPFLLPVIGAVGEVLLNLSTGIALGGFGPLAAMAGNALREMYDQWKKNGVGFSGPRVGDPPVTPGPISPPA